MSSWSKQDLLDFIEEYRKHECIWKVKAKSYQDRDKKEHAYNCLVQLVRRFDPSASRDTVLKKINNIRSSFRKERKKVLCSLQDVQDPADVYKPKLWYYQDLSFLVDQEEYGQGKSTLEENSDEDISANEVEEWEAIAASTAQELTQDIPPPSFECAYQPLPCRQVKRNDNSSLTDQLFGPIVKRLADSSTEDSYDLFGKYIASKLRSFNKHQRIFAQKVMNDALFEAELGTLTRYASVDTGGHPSPSGQRAGTGYYSEQQEQPSLTANPLRVKGENNPTTVD